MYSYASPVIFSLIALLKMLFWYNLCVIQQDHSTFKASMNFIMQIFNDSSVYFADKNNNRLITQKKENRNCKQ